MEGVQIFGTGIHNPALGLGPREPLAQFLAGGQLANLNDLAGGQLLGPLGVAQNEVVGGDEGFGG